jgi:hypothetical protein
MMERSGIVSRRRGWQAAALMWCTSIVTTLPAPALDGPILNRYSLSIPLTGANVGATVDSAVLDEFCRDEDGCDVILSVETAVVPLFDSRRVRLHLEPGGDQWSAGGAANGTDGNSTVEHVAIVSISASSCLFSDADSEALDPGLGFTLQALVYPSQTVQCNLVLID